ncbi:MAG: hypothetical protein JWL73_1892 [Actinomycetia bacterium]|nr:hypothetical protein [Actinomycetes bacterium]
MGAVGMLATSGLRRRWRSVVVLTLLVGAISAVVLAAAAGARRSDTALARFNQTSRSDDLSLLPAFQYTPTPAQLAAVRRIPNVTGIAVLRFFAVQPVGLPPNQSGGMGAAVDGAMGRVVDRPRLIAGRRPDPAAADEVAIDERLAGQQHLAVGSHVDVDSLTPAELAAAIRSRNPPAPAGPRVRLRIVGIERQPSTLGDAGAGGGFIALTPAFNEKYFQRIGNLGVTIAVRIRDGAAGVPAVAKAARPIFAKSGGVSPQANGTASQGAQNAINVLTLALWIFAGVAALAGVVTVGFVLTRDIAYANADQSTLRALGLTRAQRAMVSGPRILLVAAGGTLLAVAGAMFGSPLLPVGLARRADPNPGFHADWVVLGFGALGVASVAVLIAAFAALRSTRASLLDDDPGRWRRPSKIVDAASRAGLTPSVTSGLRMALERGRGRTAVPVRAACLGAVFGVLGVTAVLVFAGSLDNLVTTPHLYGSTSGFQTTQTNFNSGAPDACNRSDFGLTRVRGVSTVAALCSNDTQIDGRPLRGWGFTNLRGTVQPEITAGRAPRTAGEVALGAVTLRKLHKSIGDTVTGRGRHGTVDYRIVGRAVLPVLGAEPLADGAFFTGAGLARVYDGNNSSGRYLLGDYAPTVDRTVVDRRIAALSGLGNPARSPLPVEIARLRQTGWFPTTLAALLTCLALVAVGSAIVTAVRRRRRDLALLKTLGFERHQVRSTVAWQATTLGAIGLLGGLPIGLIVGTSLWHVVADEVGVSSGPDVPRLAVFLIIPVTLLLVNAIAFLPARAAARTRPAVALRAE